MPNRMWRRRYNSIKIHENIKIFFDPAKLNKQLGLKQFT